ncbi:MAG: hypothetical protein AAF502_06150 [Bacteroidota bacterium]
MKKSNRRQFLKTTSFAVLSLGTFPHCLAANKKSNADLIQDGLEGDCPPTTLDLYGEGPFYTANPPVIQEFMLAGESEPGTRLIVSGRVYDLSCNEFIPNTIIDVWHANDAGAYDNQGYNLRGQTTSNAQGYYMFNTIRPGKYLNGSQFRPSHIHFKITPPGFPTLTTQLYFEGDTDIPADAAASVTTGQFDASDRIIPLTTNDDGHFEGTWDIIINGDGITVGTSNLHIDKGMIYEVTPNPFNGRLDIRYGVFRKSIISLLVHDLNGREVAKLEERELVPEKYTATWEPEGYIPNGHYFVSLKVNGQQVHYSKVLLQRV